jgi:hypothetical protein
VATWFSPPENPFLRKFYMADRQRDAARARADWQVNEKVQLGLTGEFSKDAYSTNAAIGLKDSRSASIGADISAALTDELSLHAFAQGDRIRSRQLGSQAFAAEDWSGHVRDSSEVLGVGVKHVQGKLELAADAVATRSRSAVTINMLLTLPQFPSAKTSRDSLRLSATYKLQDKLSLIGSIWHERYEATDWHFDGVLPGTLFNFLSLGDQPPRYSVNVVRLGVRYSF